MPHTIYASLTSIFQNQTELLKTLISLNNQTLKPSKIYVYLSETAYLLDIGFKNRLITNKSLLEYLNKNQDSITVSWTENTGPFRKLLPLLKEKWDEDCLIITFDDDVEYKKNLIENMVKDYDVHKCVINYRGFTLDINNINYNHRIKTIPKYLYNFPTGNAGILYHPRFFIKTKDIIFDKNIYTDCCKTGDDIWFMFMRICNNIECYIDSKPYKTKCNITKSALCLNYNFKNNNNTIMLRNTIKKLKDMNYISQCLEDKT